MNIKNVKIRTRLWLGFSIILLLVMLLGGIALWHSGIIWNNTSYLYQHPFKVNIAVRELETHVMAMQRSMKNVTISDSQEELSAAVHDITVNESQVYRLFDSIYALYLGKKGSVDSALSAFREWKPERDETIRLSQSGMYKEAVSRTKTVGEFHVHQIMGKMKVLKDFALNRADSFYNSAEKGRNQLYIQLWVVLLLIILISIAVFSFIMRGITYPLQEMVTCVEHYGQGRYHIRNKNSSTNELGVLATSLNKLAEAVQFNMNVKNGTLAIADVMLANDELPLFCSSVMEVLMQKTMSNLGAVFFLNESDGLFEPYFSIGFNSEKLRSFSAGLNEGEFGSVLTGKKLMKVTHVPDDSVFIFPTVAGSLKPKEIITIPVIRRNQVVAVVSLASIGVYSDESMEIIRQSEKNLNMSMNAILTFDRIRQYAESLDKQNEKLNYQARELQLQTSELVEQNTELEMQKHQIDEANRLKSQFLSSMSHELRTPLNSVIALSGVLYKRLKDQIEEEEYSYLEIIERNGKNLLALINDILDLSRIESGKTDLHYSQFSIFGVVQQLVDSMTIHAKSKSIELINKINPAAPLIISDHDKCHHILQNIIANAVKFTEKGSVNISADVSDTEVLVKVADTGIGIAADQLSFIFDEFRQVDGTTSKHFGGTGLGLAIADKYTRMLKGRIEVSSEPGKGSVFTIVIPMEILSGQQETLPSTGFVKSYHDDNLPDLQLADTTAKTILVVEDSEPVILQLTWILQEQGYNVEIARNGFQALAAVKMKVPDAIILDLMMPGMDGFETLEKMRGTFETAAIPVLILTAMYLTSTDLKRLKENHVHQLIQKGDVNKSALLAIVRQMLFPHEKTAQEALRHQSPSPAPRIQAPARILIIDDNADNGTTLKVLLQDKHTITCVNNGVDGIAMAKERKPDLILLDISLPGIDGYTVFDEIRKACSHDRIPIIAVTAKAMKGDREHILAYGFDDYISKPVDLAVFEQTLSRWISDSPGI
jgi:signal transduction histidine kinase/DNA-binding response OmpR family regulator/HAMP domain-containing protein